MEHAASGNVVVLYGALRSGTTMLRLLLDGHPDISCRGETDFLFDHFRPGPGDQLVLDIEALKADRIFQNAGLPLPTATDAPGALTQMIDAIRARGDARVHVLVLHRHLDLLRRMLPGMRLLHLLRDPRDVARSSIGMGWAGNTWYGVDHWIGTESDWQARKLPGELVFSLRYEDFLQTPEQTLTALCGFLGLGYDPVMLRLEERSSYEPIDPGLAWQWRRKQSPRELAELEAKIGPLLTASGYAPAGPAPTLPGPWRRLRLWLQNKRHVWKVRIERYGLADPLILAVSGRLGLPRLGRGAQARINRRVQDHLK